MNRMNVMLLNKADEKYLKKCVTGTGLSYGIVIGQNTEPGKYVIVHLAKNFDDDVDDDLSVESTGPHNIDEIDLQSLTSQWVSANKMIPGSFEILGIFIAVANEKFVDESTEEFKSLKKLLYDLHNMRKQSNDVGNSLEPKTEYLLLVYCNVSRRAVCKIYNYVSNGGTFVPMDYRFVDKPFEWHCFECNYDMDDIYPIVQEFNKIKLEDHFQRVLNSIRRNLDSSEIFIQDEHVDDGQLLETYVKRRREQQKQNGVIENYFRCSVMLPIKCVAKNAEIPIKVQEFQGSMRLQGVVTSRIWCNPKNTLATVKHFIRMDLMRSLLARIHVYCDGITDPMTSNESVFMSEPPRRVYFDIFNTTSNTRPVQFSEYIFRGEAPTVAVAQAKHILDLDIASDNIITDLEGLPDDDLQDMDDYDASEVNSSKEKTSIKAQQQSSKKQDISRFMYMLGVSIALLVLIISIFINFLIN